MKGAQKAALAWWVWAAAWIVGAGLVFYLPAALGAGGHAPVPLDDSYIYFGFARSIGLGHPFEAFPGSGYSSGATSLLYPFVLAPGWLLGFRGEWLAVFAALVAVACLFDACRSLASLVPPRPALARWFVPPLLLSVPLCDWSLFSGMETALVAALLGRAVAATAHACDAAPGARRARQLALGGWLALCVLSRPETLVLALGLALAAAHGGRSLRAPGSLLRALAPLGLALALVALANHAFTGEAAPAGAVRKLVSSDPYIEPATRAVAVVRSFALLYSQGLLRALGGAPWCWGVPLLGLAGLLASGRRTLVGALWLGAAGAVALACLNTTAAFQNFRYAVPSLLMLLAAAALGLGSAARAARARGLHLGRAGLAAYPLALVAVGAALRELPRQVDHFARASRNIAEQQVAAAARVADRGTRLAFVNDAGAIPYLSGVPALDGWGLGGYRELPFARASVHGVPAVVELVERLPPDARPDLLAIYPGWWPGLPETFGRELERIHIEDNVICGADDKVLYAADWSPLGPAPDASGPDDALDELDVADLVSERSHGYALPARGGHAVAAVLALADGSARWDGGRIVPEGERERFEVRAEAGAGRRVLTLRSDAGSTPGRPRRIAVEVSRKGRMLERVLAELPPATPGRWLELAVPLDDVRGGDAIAIESLASERRSFHLWLGAADGP